MVPELPAQPFALPVASASRRLSRWSLPLPFRQRLASPKGSEPNGHWLPPSNPGQTIGALGQDAGAGREIAAACLRGPPAPLDGGGAPREEAALLRPIQAAARIEGVEAARRRAAPPPTTKRAGIMHMRRAPAFTYAMELEGASQPAFKIGWAFDYKARERQFNLAALPQLNGLRYRAKLFQFWATAIEAFRMEQSLLRTFNRLRHPANPESRRSDRTRLSASHMASVHHGSAPLPPWSIAQEPCSDG
jgi:hypothetical protein